MQNGLFLTNFFIIKLSIHRFLVELVHGDYSVDLSDSQLIYEFYLLHLISKNCPKPFFFYLILILFAISLIVISAHQFGLQGCNSRFWVPNSNENTIKLIAKLCVVQDLLVYYFISTWQCVLHNFKILQFLRSLLLMKFLNLVVYS